MLAILVLLIIAAVVIQLIVATSTDARVARNDVTLTAMDLTAESALLMKFDQLIQDAEADSAEDGAAGGDGGLGGGAFGGLGGGGLGGGGGVGGDPAAGGASGPVDSREDEWAAVESTDSLNEMRVRVLVQDENSKYNVLSMLDPDELAAEKAMQRVARVIDLFREGTETDVDTGEAERMAELMRDHLLARTDLARGRLATDDSEAELVTKPLLSLRELVIYPEFPRHLFRDERTPEGDVVHSLTSYLTCWSSMQTRAEWDEARQSTATAGAGQGGGVAGGGGGGSGGAEGPSQTTTAGQGAGGNSGQQISGVAGAGDSSGAEGLGNDAAGTVGGIPPTNGKVNVNTAPPVVLKALMDDRDLDPRFWDEVILFRNEEDESQSDPDAEPVYDQFGEEEVPLQFFSSVEALANIEGYEQIEPVVRDEAFGLIGVSSDVFTIIVTVQRDTAALALDGTEGAPMTREQYEEQLYSPSNLTRTIACTVWRRSDEESGVELVPLQRWEYLDYIPYEVLDYPGEDR
ncbi:MAG: hypothetical protein ACYTFV_01825 [Planctomycetota bacterium]|jgi:hypothetical protein